MNLPPITIEIARDLLRRAMETQGPDFVYNTNGELMCFYEPRFPDGPLTDDHPMVRTGCIVGTALTMHGFSAFDPHQPLPIDTLARVLRENQLLDIDEQSADYFRVAQRAQDEGESWGYALAQAEDWLTGRTTSTTEEFGQ